MIEPDYSTKSQGILWITDIDNDQTPVIYPAGIEIEAATKLTSVRELHAQLDVALKRQDIQDFLYRTRMNVPCILVKAIVSGRTVTYKFYPNLRDKLKPSGFLLPLEE
jgi:hypothetical protein